jgi:two-component system response regulator HydG
VEDLPERVRQLKDLAHSIDCHPMELITAAELEQRYIAQVMAATNGNKTLAARILGCDRRTIHRKLDAGAHAPTTKSTPLLVTTPLESAAAFPASAAPEAVQAVQTMS